MTQDLLFGLPVDCSILFSNQSNILKEKIKDQQKKFLIKIRFIKHFLDHDERIIFIAKGYSPSNFFLQLLTGWIFIYLKRSLLVFTNKRLFHIPTTSNYVYRNSISHIMYSNLQSICVKRRSLIVECTVCGQKEKFSGIGKKAKAKIMSLIKTIPFESQKDIEMQRLHLCPRCTKGLKRGIYLCGNCNLKFKSKNLARILSVIIPGGGYFYLRMRLMGIIFIMAEAAILFYVYMTWLDLNSDITKNIFILSCLGAALICERIFSFINSTHFADEFITKSKKKVATGL